ncbi:laccase-14 [Eucalyptus grandis]|uniref:laccase-14 n=1 Tax=Eucalyptus grandis TaxID=71139 RepID=UPI00192EADB4|nr:laccase-14 [Eucalyptus grandis]
MRTGGTSNKMALIAAFLGFVFLEYGSLLCMARGNVQHYDFVLKETNFTRLCTTKSMLVVNESWPGPVIRVHKGDTVFVTVHNNGTYGVTVHWHGVKQPRNPWPDGPENITQCPIPAGTSFTQELSFSDEEGTLWWHAHSDWSRATVHGAIIIYPKPGTTYPYPVPYKEELLVLGEWYNGDVMAIIDEALETGGDPNTSDAFAINGQPGDLYDCSNASTYRLLVNYGKTYLLRIVNAVMNEEIFFGIAKHNLTVVGMDGGYVKPINTDYIMITPGQTMDVLVTANQSPSHYYIMGSPFADTTAPFDNTSTTAIFQYSGNYTPPSTPYSPSLPAYDDKDAAGNFTVRLKSLASKQHPISVPLIITERIFITVSVNQIYCANESCAGPDGNRLSASLNNISFVTPTIDILQAYYRHIRGVYNCTFPSIPPYFFNFTGDVGNNTIYPSQGTKAKVIKYGSAVEIIFQGTNVGAAENHPMHLHGYSFYVVGMGNGNFDFKTSPKTYNLVDPPLVNTIGVPKNGWTTIRFVADNPGVWFMHCHLERHASWGMDTVLIVTNGPANMNKMREPPAYMPPCAKS